jgi:GNAT superfamily N-acetyltransferase
MTYSLVPFTQQHLDSAIELFLKGYSEEKLNNPFLPSRALDDPSWIRTKLQSALYNPGVVVVEDNKLLAYLVSGDFFFRKGQQAAFVPEYGHSAINERKQRLYQIMYQALAQEWLNRGCHLHLIGHFAHDNLLQTTLYHFGFGLLIAERLRDDSSLGRFPGKTIKEIHNPSELINLHMEHIRYYSESPIFISRSTDSTSALDDLRTHAQNGDAIFTYYDQSEPCAYMIVGESSNTGEGFLLQNTKTAQIKSAYARTEFRGIGIGEALLQHAIQWAQQHGYERVFVEHETANVAGGNFWSKYFTPYLYFSMRYIDSTL